MKRNRHTTKQYVKNTLLKLFVPFLMLWCLTSSAQPRVGLNCTNPSSMFEIRGAEADLYQTFNNTNTANRSGIRFQSNGTTKFAFGLDNADTIFKLGTTAINAGVRLAIDKNGFIGVGNIAPTTRLHILETGASDAMLTIAQTNAGNYDPIFRFENGTTFWSMGMRDADNDLFSICQNADLSANQRFLIKAGNVGIGTANVADMRLHLLFNTAVDDGITMNQGRDTSDNVIFWKLSNVEKFQSGINCKNNDAFEINGGGFLNPMGAFCITTTGNVGVNCDNPPCTFGLNGSFGIKYNLQSATYTADATDYYIEMNSAGAARTVNLPAIAGCTGRIYIIKRVGAGNNVTIDPDGTETIEGATTYDIITDSGCVWIINDGGDWKMISKR